MDVVVGGRAKAHVSNSGVSESSKRSTGEEGEGDTGCEDVPALSSPHTSEGV